MKIEDATEKNNHPFFLSRWLVDSLMILLMYPDKIKLSIIEDSEDMAKVKIFFSDNINYVFLEKHMKNYWIAQYGDYPENVDSEELKGLDDEVFAFIDTLKENADRVNYMEVEWS